MSIEPGLMAPAMERGESARSGRRRGAAARAARLDPATRRAQLLACALRVFAERGMHAARHTDVAAAAGVSVSAVFFHLPTRRALVDSVLGAVEAFYRRLVGKALGGDAPAPAALFALATAFADSVDSHPDHARVWLDWSTAFADPAWPRYRVFQSRIVRTIAGRIARGQREGSVAPDLDPEGEALLMMGAAYIVVQMKITRRPRTDVERFLRTLVRSTVGRFASA